MTKLLLALLIAIAQLVFLFVYVGLLPEFKKLWRNLTFGAKRRPIEQVGILNGRMLSASHIDVLARTAEQEHEMDLMPHVDSDVKAACRVWECRQKRLPKPPKGNGGGSPFPSFTMMEAAENFKAAFGSAAQQKIMVLGEGVEITPIPEETTVFSDNETPLVITAGYIDGSVIHTDTLHMYGEVRCGMWWDGETWRPMNEWSSDEGGLLKP